MKVETYVEGISLEDAKKALLSTVNIDELSECISLSSACGRVLSENVYASIHQPPFPRSPLDGYALQAENIIKASQDKPVVLEVVASVYAGDDGLVEVREGQAVRIMTGAPIPTDCDAVIRQEDTDYGAHKVKIYSPVEAYRNYCFEGEDYKAGEILVEKGSILTAERIGIIASTGKDCIHVRKKLRVGVLTTGAELVCPGEDLKSGEIFNSNQYSLAARLSELGCEPVILRHVGDDLDIAVEEIRLKFDAVDVIISTGGVSVGQRDILHDVHAKLKATKLFWKLNMKPGSPALASIYKGKLFLSLSGNPMACGVTFELLFADLLSSWMKVSELTFERLVARVDGGYPKSSGMRRFIKAKLIKDTVYLCSDNIASGNLKSTVDSNCLIDVPAGSGEIRNGDTVKVIRYRRT